MDREQKRKQRVQLRCLKKLDKKEEKLLEEKKPSLIAQKAGELTAPVREKLREKVPDGIPLIAESGIKEREDIRKLEEAGVRGVLIGETFMRSLDKSAMLAYLKGQKL